MAVLSWRKGTFQRKDYHPPAFTGFLQSRSTDWLPRGYTLPVCTDIFRRMEAASESFAQTLRVALREVGFPICEAGQESVARVLTANMESVPGSVVNTPHILIH